MPLKSRAAPLLAALALGGCGSGGVGDLPPAAEPAPSPPLEASPAGRVFELPERPEGVAVDPQTGIVAVALRNPDEVALVDGGSGRELRRVPVPESARHLAVAEPGGPFLVPSERADRLAVIDIPEGSVRTVEVGPYPHAAVASRGRFFVADEHDRTVSVVEGGRRIARVTVATQPGGLAVLERGATVVAVSVRERAIDAIDVDTLQAFDREPVGVGPTHVVTDERNLAYVADTAGGAILVVRLRPRLQVVRRVYMPGSPYGIAIDNRRRRLFVTLTATNELVELTADGRPLERARHPTVRQPDTVAVDERTGRVFVTGLADGVLQRIEQRTPAR